jgi:hypothetical protein
VEVGFVNVDEGFGLSIWCSRLRPGLIQFRESGSVRGFNDRLLDKQHHVGFE